MKLRSIIRPSTLNFLFACTVFSQSSFELANLDLPLVDAPVFDAQSVPLAGPNYLVELWGAATPDALAPLVDLSRGSTRDIVPFMTGGYFVYPYGFLSVPSLLPYGYAWLQVRAWDARLGATYEAAVTAGLGGYGASPLFYAKGGNPVSPTPTPGAPLIGLQSFNLLPEVPEPCSWALLAFGAISVVLARSRRRRKQAQAVRTLVHGTR